MVIFQSQGGSASGCLEDTALAGSAHSNSVRLRFALMPHCFKSKKVSTVVLGNVHLNESTCDCDVMPYPLLLLVTH
jgi:hypothetical protein